MSLILIFLGILFNTTLRAESLSFSSPQLSYELNYGVERIQLRSFMVDLSLDRKSCNDFVLERFQREMKKTLKRELSSENSQTPVKVLWQKKAYYLVPNGPTHRKFQGMIDEIHRMKVEEKELCTSF